VENINLEDMLTKDLETFSKGIEKEEEMIKENL